MIKKEITGPLVVACVRNRAEDKSISNQRMDRVNIENYLREKPLIEKRKFTISKEKYKKELAASLSPARRF